MPALYHYQHAALTRGRQLCATFFFFPPRFFASLPVPLHRGGSRISGRGGGVLNNIPKPGGGGGGGGGEGVLEGACPSRDSKGVWGSPDSSTSGVWGFAPAAFYICVYLA